MKRLLAISLLAVVSGAMATEFGPGAAFAIPDSSATGGQSTINVSGQNPVVGSLNWVRVEFGTTRSTTGSTRWHTWVGDLIAIFTHVSSGTSMHLFSRTGATTGTSIGDSSNLAGSYKFFETGSSFAAEAALGTTSYILRPGDYARSTHAAGAGAGNSSNGTAQYNAGTFASFTGLAMNGDWNLKVVDNAGGDVGDVVSWSFDATPTPEPASLAVLGLGAAVLLRRKQK
ncbi:MAG: PEP-CTERM sorting domain-containing protein [Armatimonadetes bacterium]|nr:PEP-CTERM sorting domain-containing protein [Armatimonadota bacterium]